MITRGRIVLAIGAVIALAGCSAVTGGSSKTPTQQAQGYISSMHKDINAVQVSVQSMQVGIALLQKGGVTTDALNQFAQLAQQAHDTIDGVRQDFGTNDTSGNLGNAEVELFTAANDLKNAMGAVVAYTGNPNPATLAHFTSQYQTGVGQWDDGVKTIWSIAQESNPPTVGTTTSTATPQTTSASSPTSTPTTTTSTSSTNTSATLATSTSVGLCHGESSCGGYDNDPRDGQCGHAGQVPCASPSSSSTSPSVPSWVQAAKNGCPSGEILMKTDSTGAPAPNGNDGCVGSGSGECAISEPTCDPANAPGSTPATSTAPSGSCSPNMLPNDQGQCVPPAAMCPPTGPAGCTPSPGAPSLVYEDQGPTGQINMYWSNGRMTTY